MKIRTPYWEKTKDVMGDPIYVYYIEINGYGYSLAEVFQEDIGRKTKYWIIGSMLGDIKEESINGEWEIVPADKKRHKTVKKAKEAVRDLMMGVMKSMKKGWLSCECEVRDAFSAKKKEKVSGNCR